MSPSGVIAITPSAIETSLAAKIECAILSVLVQCHGQFEESLDNWFWSLKQAFPEMERAGQIRDVFKQLCEEGVIGLNGPWIGDYNLNCGDEEFYFLALDRFTVSLTARGVVRWHSIRR